MTKRGRRKPKPPSSLPRSVDGDVSLKDLPRLSDPEFVESLCLSLGILGKRTGETSKAEAAEEERAVSLCWGELRCIRPQMVPSDPKEQEDLLCSNFVQNVAALCSPKEGDGHGVLCKKKFVALILRDLAEDRLELKVFMILLCLAENTIEQHKMFPEGFADALPRTLPSLRPGLLALLNSLDEVEAKTVVPLPSAPEGPEPAGVGYVYAAAVKEMLRNDSTWRSFLRPYLQFLLRGLREGRIAAGVFRLRMEEAGGAAGVRLRPGLSLERNADCFRLMLRRGDTNFRILAEEAGRGTPEGKFYLQSGAAEAPVLSDYERYLRRRKVQVEKWEEERRQFVEKQLRQKSFPSPEKGK